MWALVPWNLKQPSPLSALLQERILSSPSLPKPQFCNLEPWDWTIPCSVHGSISGTPRPSFHSCISTCISVSVTMIFYGVNDLFLSISSTVWAQAHKKNTHAYLLNRRTKIQSPFIYPVWDKVTATDMDDACYLARQRSGIKKECLPCTLTLTGQWYNLQSHVSISDHIRQ